jgi:putative alpha-1,2-mannosidase
VTLTLPGEKTFTVKANNLSPAHKYVQAIRLNGQPVTGKIIKYDDIRNGGLLEFDMTDQATIY